MYIPTEYVQVIEADLQKLLQMVDAQQAVIDYVKGTKSYNNLVIALGAVTGILGVIFALTTPVSVAMGIVSVLTNLSGSEKENLLSVLKSGKDGLYTASRQLIDYPKYDKLKVRLPFLRYYDSVNSQYLTLVQGEGQITAVHTSNPPVWIEK